MLFTTIRLVTQMCYTFDAGPNACLFVPAAAVGQVMALLLKVFPPSDHCSMETYVRGLPTVTPQLLPSLEALGTDLVNSLHSTNSPSGVRLQYMLHTTVGEGPRIIARASHNNSNTEDNSAATAPPPPSCHLIDPLTGNPIFCPAIS